MYHSNLLFFLLSFRFIFTESAAFQCVSDEKCNCTLKGFASYYINCNDGTKKVMKSYGNSEKIEIIFVKYLRLNRTLESSDLIIYPKLQNLRIESIFIGNIKSDLLKGIQLIIHKNTCILNQIKRHFF